MIHFTMEGSIFAPVSQLVEEVALKAIQYGFESHQEHVWNKSAYCCRNVSKNSYVDYICSCGWQGCYECIRGHCFRLHYNPAL